MNTILLIYLLLPLQFIVMSLSPGLWIVRRFRFGAIDRLIVGIGVGWIFHYLIGTVGRLTEQVEAGFAFSIGAALLGLLPCLKELRILWRRRFSRNVILAMLLVAGVALVLLHSVIMYSGLSWAGDWVEHYQRAHFFLNDPQFPRDYSFIGIYLLPARPPLQNVATALLLFPQGDAMWPFLIATSLLNALTTAAALAQLPIFTRHARRCLWLGAALLMLNPLYIENLTYAWTKSFAAFYALVGFRLYIHAVRRNRKADWCACGLMMVAGCLVHYSIAPYVIVLGLDLLRRLWWRPRLLGPAATGAICAMLLAVSWFGWSIAWYGTHGTVATNTAVTESAGATPLEIAGRIANNYLVTLLPANLWNDIAYCLGAWGFSRDLGFILYQLTLPFTMGLAALMVLPLAWRRWRGHPGRRWTVAYAALVFLIGVGVVGGRQELGQAHLCLPAMILQGVMLVAANLPALPRDGRQLLVPILYVVDLLWGIVIHFGIQASPPQFVGDPPRFVPDPNLSIFANESLYGRLGRPGWAFPGDVIPYSIRLALIILAAAVILAVFIRGWRKAMTIRRVRARPA